MVALRAYARYVVPLTVLGAIACAPLLVLAWKAQAPRDLAGARMQIRIAWVCAGGALAWKLWLVAGVAPAVRSVAAGAPLSQLGALSAGLHGLARGLVPWVIAVTAVLIGGLAFVVPGVLLAILVALTGASRELGTTAQAALADGIAVARTQLPRVAIVVGAIVAIDLAVTLAAQLEFVPALSKKMAASKLAPIRTFVRVALLAAAALAPLGACLLAACYVRATNRDASHAERR